MQGQIDQMNSLVLDFLEQVFCEMKAGSRSGCGAIFLGIDGLVAFAVLQFFMDVGRQGHFPQAF